MDNKIKKILTFIKDNDLKKAKLKFKLIVVDEPNFNYSKYSKVYLEHSNGLEEYLFSINKNNYSDIKYSI